MSDDIGAQARSAFIESIADQMDKDATPELESMADAILIRLYLRGFIVSVAPSEDVEDGEGSE